MKTILATTFGILITILTLSGFVWFVFNRYLVRKFPNAGKIMFWLFVIGFILAILVMIVSVTLK